ncbi:DUF6199 family natural product biosynthesis protein [Clostridium isatidis]|uniref:Histidine kinase n=2 Tax=Clostridium isatidis TaxID=182773 RepID=A0A343JBH9_9CLOT|nr:DUF6199 family natural product biosynthesis protein [Clostridium isatidis]ASW42887.1 histidine kinase [Clostridium isatidis]NLZ34218.1 histidine kinase [Clostridiales bacterium]
MVFIKIIISIFLIIDLINPRFGWKLSEGWKYKDLEPSESYLFWSRVKSLLILIIIWFLLSEVNWT